ncbi:MAG: UPF0410 protein, partial [uncultured Rubrobacteraceae bacterium]
GHYYLDHHRRHRWCASKADHAGRRSRWDHRHDLDRYCGGFRRWLLDEPRRYRRRWLYLDHNSRHRRRDHPARYIPRGGGRTNRQKV